MKPMEELVTVIEDEETKDGDKEASEPTFADILEADLASGNIAVIEEEIEVESGEKQAEKSVKAPRKATRKEIFNGFYEESKKLKK